ncbi:MAG: GNAT family N-acetyltransferase [Bdellovibrionota bacterium]
MDLETERLKLRILKSDDAEAYFDLSQNDGFRQFQITDYRKTSVNDARTWLTQIESYHQRNKLGILGVFRKDTDELIGLSALKYLDIEAKSPVELMYRIKDSQWGHGFGIEIAKALVNHAFSELNLESLTATVDVKNTASKNILLKLGFEFKKIIKIGQLDEELYVLKNG